MSLQLWLTLVIDEVDVMTYVFAPGASPMLGRDDSANDIVLHDPGVSRVHARLVDRGDRFAVQDLGSTGGTYVDDERIEREATLPPVSMIRIGPYRLRARVQQWVRQDEDDADATLMLDPE